MVPPRVSWHASATPLQPAPRLGDSLGFGPGKLWVKRDDLTGLAGGGNKARKLEYLCGAALAEGADTLLTGGAAQSNHVRMTAAAAAALGLRCVAVLFGRSPEVTQGNLLLDDLLGAEVIWAGGAEPTGALADAEDRLAADGARVYSIPLGGSSPVGVLGYVDCAAELRRDAPDDAIVVAAAGSGGTVAGLAAGLGDFERVHGVDVGFGELEGRIADLANAAAELAGRPEPSGAPWIERYQADPYGAPTLAARDALFRAARSEGLVLDPVYTARALAGLEEAQRAGRFGDRPVVFLHTGGMPALFTDAYSDWFPPPLRPIGDLVVRPTEEGDRPWIADTVAGAFASPIVARRGEAIDVTELPALVATDRGQPVGVASYRLEGFDCELAALVSTSPGSGTALLAELERVAARAGCGRIWVVTTNDNLPALEFYQGRGFELVEVRPGAVEEARQQLKPTIPRQGPSGLPIRDELELERRLEPEPG